MNRLTEKMWNDYFMDIRGNSISNAYSRKLGKLEDTFELIEEMYKKPVCWKGYDGEEEYEYYTHSTILYNPKTNEIEIYEYEFIASYKVEEYGLTWWLSKTKEE